MRFPSMRWWPWAKKTSAPKPDPGHLEEATEERKRAEKDLSKVRSQRREIERIANRIREIREQNHLAEMFEESIRNRGKPHHG